MPSFRLAAALAAGIAIASSAQAETRIFLLKSNDSYGVDRCLAAGEQCGRAAAAALCRAREFAQAIDFGRIDPGEITGSLALDARTVPCEGRFCPQLVAITCAR